MRRGSSDERAPVINRQAQALLVYAGESISTHLSQTSFFAYDCFDMRALQCLESSCHFPSSCVGHR